MSQTVTTPESYFETNKYVLLQDVLTEDFCAELTRHMFKLLMMES